MILELLDRLQVIWNRFNPLFAVFVFGVVFMYAGTFHSRYEDYLRNSPHQYEMHALILKEDDGDTKILREHTGNDYDESVLVSHKAFKRRLGEEDEESDEEMGEGRHGLRKQRSGLHQSHDSHDSSGGIGIMRSDSGSVAGGRGIFRSVSSVGGGRGGGLRRQPSVAGTVKGSVAGSVAGSSAGNDSFVLIRNDHGGNNNSNSDVGGSGTIASLQRAPSFDIFGQATIADPLADLDDDDEEEAGTKFKRKKLPHRPRDPADGAIQRTGSSGAPARSPMNRGQSIRSVASEDHSGRGPVLHMNRGQSIRSFGSEDQYSRPGSLSGAGGAPSLRTHTMQNRLTGRSTRAFSTEEHSTGHSSSPNQQQASGEIARFPSGDRTGRGPAAGIMRSMTQEHHFQQRRQQQMGGAMSVDPYDPQSQQQFRRGNRLSRLQGDHDY